MKTQRLIFFLGALLIMHVINLLELEFTYAQIAKIHRKVAQVSVSPAMLVNETQSAVSVRRFDPDCELRVRFCGPDGAELLSETVPKNASVFQTMVEVPDGIDDECKVQVEMIDGDSAVVVAEASVRRIDSWFDELREQMKRIEAVEASSQNDAVMLRAAWAALAYGEDLMERAKKATAGEVWDLRRRLNAITAKADSLEKGRDPLGEKSGYQLRGYRSEINGEMQLYSLYIPKEYDGNQEWPFVVMLHGAWSNHHLALRRVFGLTNKRGEDDDAAKRRMPQLPDVPYIVVSVNGFETQSYEGYAEEDVWRVMDEVKALFNVDEDRTYITGLSMGGGGTLKLAFRNPGVFAAAAPVCGSVYLHSDIPDADAPEFQHKLQQSATVEQIAVNMKYTPVFFMHGDKDPVVPVSNSLTLDKRLRELGYQSKLEIYPGVDHAAWEPAYQNARVFDWFKQFKRDPYPREVIFKTGEPYGGSAYWTAIDELKTIRQHAQIEARAEGNTITVKTDNVERLRLSPPTSLFPEGEKIKVVIDGQEVAPIAYGSSQHFEFKNETWSLSQPMQRAHIYPARQGLHAPFWGKHVYAFGSDGSSDETTVAKGLAFKRSMRGGNADVQWKVLAGSDLSEDILQDNHVVLYSTTGASSFLQKHKDKLPMSWDDKGIHFAERLVTPDQALVAVVANPANPQKYLLLLISTTVQGLHALQDFESGRSSLRTLSEGDFVVIGPHGHYIWGGLFDKHWSVAETDDFPLKN
ncbi:MAG: prolyl oligopeptidase family serine peptidase [Candidatus Hinthialibacter antarcticus]|nr:prolyl oligopeptidase family serine peptidase [Candidatus Hinthialibacter antarcticus]